MRVVISARVADGARVEPALGPRLEDPSPGRRSVGAWATRSAVDGRSRGTEDAREEWKFPMVTWEVSGETHSRHAWWTLERSSLHEQGVGDRNSSAPFTSHVLSQQMRHTGLWVSSSPPEELECIFL